MQYKTATTHGILVPPQSPQKESSCAPQGLLLERVYPGTDKHDWNNQCFSILKTLYPKHRSRGGQASAAGQRRALPVPQPAVPTGDTHRKAVLETHLQQRLHAQPAFSYIPKSLHKKGWWLNEFLCKPFLQYPVTDGRLDRHSLLHFVYFTNISTLSTVHCFLASPATLEI